MNNKRMSQMSPLQEGVIQTIERTDLPCVQRLMVLGLVEGSHIKYLGAALSGDPIEVMIEGSRLSLHKDCASHFFVS